MRIPIREQLAALVLLSTLIGLAVIAVATWITNHNLVVGLRSSTLEVTASLKAAQLSSNLALYERSARGLASRVLLQQAIARYNRGNNTVKNWIDFAIDFQSAAQAQQQQLTLQTIIYPRSSVIGGDPKGLVRVTDPVVHIDLPYNYANGTPVVLGDPGRGYPANLYPNLTFDTFGAYFQGQRLNSQSTILLGPWQINSTYSLFSITVPIINNTSANSTILGYSGLILNAQLFIDVVESPIGLDETGTVLLIGPDDINNRFRNRGPHPSPTSLGHPVQNDKVHFILPPDESRYRPRRHALRDYGTADAPFRLSSYPAIVDGLDANTGVINHAGSDISCQNEEGQQVSIGFAIPQSELCDWILVVEEAKSEAFQAIVSLRNILLACVFGTAGGMILLIYPLAHYSSRPIRRLRDATKKSVEPVETPNGGSTYEPSQSSPLQNGTVSANKDGVVSTLDEKKSPRSSWGRMWRAKKPQVDVESTMTLQSIRMPSKVEDGKHWIEDELTDLTQTFNEMSDELLLQYSKLEERVRLRTAELEISKKAAEAANESKTLFIANISHELKTPLNGILGMCAVCMQEDDLSKIKRSLGIIYKSGDLLHHLLTDLLTFSKNQAGKYLSLDEKEFRLRDVGSQLHAIFQTQASERKTSFSISYQGPWNSSGPVRGTEDGEYGPPGTGKVREMCLWGDIQRILQVTINLISNSLKFTPGGGTVNLRIKCVERNSQVAPLSRQDSTTSNKSDRRPKPSPHVSSESNEIVNDTKNMATAESGLRERSSFASGSSDIPVQPPTDADTLWFEFEVSDNGPGISKPLQSRIFEPFVQGDLRLTKKYGGTGLGLSICAQLAKLMRGDIRLESTVDVGSKFTLRVPLKLCRTRADSTATSVAHMSVTSLESSLVAPNNEETQQSSNSKTFETDPNPRLIGLSLPYFSTANPPMASPTNELGKKENKLKVLVAEDNKVNQEVVLRMLRLEEIFDVHVAKDGQEALDFVKTSMELESPYDLIFMDIMMPNLDGRQSTRLIRQIGYSAPIVALTAFADEVNQKECMDSGMDYFLSKPIKRPALKHVLKTYCAPIQEMDETENKDADKFTNADPFNLTRRDPESSNRNDDSPVLTPKTTLA